MKIFLDDIRKPPDETWTVARTAGQAINMLARNIVTEISLDHDLGKKNSTGYDVLLWIERKVFCDYYIPPLIMIHTANPAARIRMEAARDRIMRKVLSREKTR